MLSSSCVLFLFFRSSCRSCSVAVTVSLLQVTLLLTIASEDLPTMRSREDESITCTSSFFRTRTPRDSSPKKAKPSSSSSSSCGFLTEPPPSGLLLPPCHGPAALARSPPAESSIHRSSSGSESPKSPAENPQTLRSCLAPSSPPSLAPTLCGRRIGRRGSRQASTFELITKEPNIKRV